MDIANSRPATATTVELDPQLCLRWGACTLMLLGLLRLLPTLSLSSFHNDFSHYYIGGSLFAAGVNVYTEPLLPHTTRLGFEYDPTIPFAAHPPLILWMFSWLSYLPPAFAYLAWLAAQVAFLAAALELTRRILDYSWSSASWLLMVGLFLNTFSVQTLFFYSQVQLLVAVMLYAAFQAHLRGRHASACSLLTLATAFKLYPLVLFPWFFFGGANTGRNWARKLLAAGTTGLICLAVPGLNNWLSFVQEGVPALAENATKWTNYSVQNWVRMVSATPDLRALNEVFPLTVDHLASLCSAAMIAGAYLYVWKGRLGPRGSFCILLTATTLAGIIAWSHYLTIFLLPVALLWGRSLNSGRPSWQLLCYGLGWLLLMPGLDSLWLSKDSSLWRILLHFYPLYVAFAVAGLLIATERER